MPYKYTPMVPKEPTEQPDGPMSNTDMLRLMGATGLRVVPQAIGASLGAAAGAGLGTMAFPGVGTVEGATLGAMGGGALAGGLGEWAAEHLEPHPHTNLGRIGVATGIGAVPGSALVKEGYPLVSALRGGLLGYSGVAGNKLAEGEGVEKSLNPTEWSRSEQVGGPLLGGIMSGVIGHFTDPKVEPPTTAKPAPKAWNPKDAAQEAKNLTAAEKYKRSVEVAQAQAEAEAATRAAAAQKAQEVTGSKIAADIEAKLAHDRQVAVSHELADVEDAKRTAQATKVAEQSRTAQEKTGGVIANDINAKQQYALKVASAQEAAQAENLKRNAQAVSEANAIKQQGKIDETLGRENMEKFGGDRVTQTTKGQGPAGEAQTIRETFAPKAPEKGEVGPDGEPLPPPSLEEQRFWSAKEAKAAANEQGGAAKWDYKKLKDGSFKLIPRGATTVLEPKPVSAQEIKDLGLPEIAPTGTPEAAPEATTTQPEPKDNGLSPEVNREVKRIVDEMETFPYVKRTWNEAPKKSGNASGGDYDIVAGAGGTPVYHDIVSAGGTGTRAYVQDVAKRLLEGNIPEKMTEGMKATLKAIRDVAEGRFAGDETLSKPWLPHTDPLPESPMSVQEFAQALSKEGQKPIADVPFSLNPEVAQQTAVQPQLTPEPEVANTQPPPPSFRVFGENMSPLERAGEEYGMMKGLKKAGLATEEGRAQAGMKASALNQASQQVPFEDQARQALTDPNIPDRIKDAIKRSLGESGAVSPLLMARLGLGTMGALAGGAMSPDQPIAGAILGGLAGAAAPSAFQGDVGQKILKRLPDLQRFNYLSEPNGLLANTIGAPTGLTLTTALEKILQGDPIGWQLLKRVPGIMGRVPKAMRRAGELLAESPENISEALPYQKATNAYDRGVAIPATMITAGHLAAADAGREAGMAPEAALHMVLANEPGQALGPENIISRYIRIHGQGLQDYKAKTHLDTGEKNLFGNLVAPFTRTASNVAAATPMRMPGVGLALKTMGAPEPWKEVLAQQGVGAMTAASAYQAGLNTDESQAPIIHKWARNLGGKYGVVASAAFMAGQAARQGKPGVPAFLKGMLEGTPMPTAEVLKDWVDFVGKVLQNNISMPPTAQDLPRSAIPGFLKSSIENQK